MIASKFEPGMMAPLTVVLTSDTDLHKSHGLALIDDVSRFLARQRRLVEVRSATQPLGSRDQLARARIGSRLGEVSSGFARMADGAGELHKGLTEGAAKLRAALWVEQATGFHLSGTPDPAASSSEHPVPSKDAREALSSGLKQASATLFHGSASSAWKTVSTLRNRGMVAEEPKPEKPQETLLRELTRAAEGAGQIADGAALAHREVHSILGDPFGRHALDRLLITEETVRDHPELARGFQVYISPDGHRARIDLTQADRVFSAGAMDQVVALRQRLDSYLGDLEGMSVKATLTGPNAESADIRAMTRSDQFRSWFIVPIGVFLVLIVALRDPLAGVNLVATMVLTYAFALGATHLVFVSILGAEGLDWKVPYFLFVLLVAVGVDYNVFLMDRVRQESEHLGLRAGIIRAVGKTGGLITSAAAITACSFASFLSSPLASLRQLGFALVVGIAIDALVVRPLLVPCGHWLLNRRRDSRRPAPATHAATPQPGHWLIPVAD
jgi:RND superfamily putative drug exporter